MGYAGHLKPLQAAFHTLYLLLTMKHAEKPVVKLPIGSLLKYKPLQVWVSSHDRNRNRITPSGVRLARHTLTAMRQNKTNRLSN